MVYVDLNSIMHSNIAYLSKWHEEFGNKSKAQRYEKISNYIMDSIENVRYNQFSFLKHAQALYIVPHTVICLIRRFYGTKKLEYGKISI